MAGLFLVFEGLDGSGKSTLINRVTQELVALGRGVTLTREPGGTPLAEDIRRLLLRTGDEVPVPATELLLYAASRAQHVAQVIQPALARGEWVLCDRFKASSVAFQCFARGLSRPNVDWLNDFAIQATKPNLTILLDLSVDESRQRRTRREGSLGATAGTAPGGDRMEQESIDFHSRVREGYLAQAKEDPEGWLVLDATKTPEQLQESVMKILKERGWLAS